jgi:hypothetical protein
MRNGCRNSGGLLPDAAPGGRAKSGQLLRGYCGVTGASVKPAPPGKTRLPCRLSCCVSSCGEEMEVWTEAEVQMPSTRQQPDNRRSAANGTNSLTIMTRSHFSEGDASCFSLRPSGNRSPIVCSAVRRDQRWNKRVIFDQSLMRVTFTRATPLFVSPILWAAAVDRSILRPGVTGPRSLILTLTQRPFCRLVTRTIDPIGSVFEAAVKPLGSKPSPFAVRRPLYPGPYQDATIRDDPNGGSPVQAFPRDPTRVCE